MNSTNFRDLIEKVREQTDIVSVISQYVTLDTHHKGICPFHKEENASFSVNAKDQYFYCFGCGAGGDVFKFLQLIENKSFMEVLNELAQRIGITISYSPEEVIHIEETRLREDILSETAKFYQKSLTSEIINYLKDKRGFNQVTIDNAQIGYANWELKKYLTKDCGFTEEGCIKAGVLKKHEDGEVKDYFYKRIVFPNLKHGRVVHLSGRSVDNTEPKYPHIPGEIKYLFNEDSLANKEVLIAEGIPDCLTAIQKGYPAVAVLGCGAFKKEYTSKFSHCEKIHICLDPDKPGLAGAMEIAELLGLRARIVELPNGQDLNEYFLEHSKEDFEKLVSKGKDFIKYKLNLIPADREKTELPRELTPILKYLAQLDSASVESYLSYEIKNYFGLTNKDIDSYRKTIKHYRKESSGSVAAEVTDRESITEELINIVLDSGAQIYLDQYKEAQITFPGKRIVGYPIGGEVFKQWLSAIYWKTAGQGISNEIFSQVTNALKGKAFHENINHTLYNRIAKIDNTIYYDLGNDTEIVKISSENWTISSDCPVYFRRFSHQLEQVKPTSGRNIRDILNFVNLKYESDKLLFLTYLVAVMFPDIPRAILISTGDQGSAKSTSLRVIRNLIDPSQSELLSPPKDIMELAQSANHNYLLYLDNLSVITEQLSDALCRLATGIGFSKRMLYTDDGDIIFNQKVAIGITAINSVAEKPDLLDRSLILNYQRIPDENRKDESTFWEEFNFVKPQLLGALFDTLSATLRILPNIKLPVMPRMADYAKHAASATQAIGNDVQDLTNALNENTCRQNNIAIEVSTTAQVLIMFMSDKKIWEGSSSELYNALRTLVDNNHLTIGGQSGFPKSVTGLWKKIKLVRPNLIALGVNADRNESSAYSIIKLTNSKYTATAASDLYSIRNDQMVSLFNNKLPIDPVAEQQALLNNTEYEDLEELNSMKEQQ